MARGGDGVYVAVHLAHAEGRLVGVQRVQLPGGEVAGASAITTPLKLPVVPLDSAGRVTVSEPSEPAAVTSV